MTKHDLLWLSHRAHASAGCAMLVSLRGGGLTDEPGYALAHRHGWGLVDGPWIGILDPPIPRGFCMPVTCRIEPVAGAAYPAPPSFLAEESPIPIAADPMSFHTCHRPAGHRVTCLDWIVSVARRLPDRYFRDLTLAHLRRRGIWHLVDQRMPRRGGSPDGPGSWVEQLALRIDLDEESEHDPTVQAAQLHWAITGPQMVPPAPLDLTMTRGGPRQG